MGLDDNGLVVPTKTSSSMSLYASDVVISPHNVPFLSDETEFLSILDYEVCDACDVVLMLDNTSTQRFNSACS